MAKRGGTQNVGFRPNGAIELVRSLIRMTMFVFHAHLCFDCVLVSVGGERISPPGRMHESAVECTKYSDNALRIRLARLLLAVFTRNINVI